MKKYKQLVIIITEDDDGHAELIKDGLRKSGICNELIRFEDGQELWDFFKAKDGKKLNDDNAYLLLLDINMPRMDGIEVLSRMKNDDNLRKIPVIMLTTTDDKREIERCYQLGCSVYITKPVDFAEFSERLKRLGLFLQIVSV